MQHELPRAPSAAMILVAGLATASCGPSAGEQTDAAGDGSTTSPSGGDTRGVSADDRSDADDDDDDDAVDTTGSGEQGTTSAVDTGGSAGMTDTGGDTAVDPSGMSFLLYGGGDFGSVFDCDFFAQDCADGEKCMPWANDGGTEFNASRCSPVAANPGSPGDACSVEGSQWSGLDDCAFGAMCFGVDPETNQGVCVSLCGGDEVEPTCPADAESCAFFDIVPLCFEPCDPLAPACADGFTCAVHDAAGGMYWCMPQSSDAEIGEACEALHSCPNGSLCAQNVPGCATDTCCVPFCDPADVGADAFCDAAGTSTTCNALPRDDSGVVGACVDL